MHPGAQLRVLEPLQHEERPLDPTEFPKRHHQFILPRTVGELMVWTFRHRRRGASPGERIPFRTPTSARVTAWSQRGRIFYQSTGQGEPMTLLHAYPLWGTLFSRVRGEFSRRSRVMTLDQRGYGMSEAPEVPGSSIAVYAQDSLDVMRQLNVPQAIIGGMFMGGPIVFEMYQRAPERFRG